MFRALLALAFAGALSIGSAARAAPPPTEAYGKLPTIEDVRISPSGDRYALVAVDGDTRKLFVSTIDNQPLYAIKVGASKVRDIEWAGEDHVLVSITATKPLGIFFVQAQLEEEAVVSINIATHSVVPIFAKHVQIFDSAVFGRYGARQIDGRWYGFFGGITYQSDASGGGLILGRHPDSNRTYADLYRVDLDTGDLKRVAEGSVHQPRWLVGQDGEVVARTTYDDIRGEWQVIAGASSVGKVLASGRYSFGRVSLPSLGRTADKLLIGRPTEDGMIYQELPLDGGAPTEAYTQDSLFASVRDPKTGLWIGVFPRGDAPQPKMFDPALDAKVQGTIRAFPGKAVRFVSWSGDLNHIIVFTTGEGDSGAYWLVDIAKHSAKPIGDAYPDVQSSDVGPIRVISWTASDGLELHGVLSLPPNRAPKNLPLVVLPNDGPRRDYPGFNWWAQAFASQGYAVFQPDPRGSAGYGEAFRRAGFGQLGRKMQTDISDGVASLARQGVIDPKRACITGSGYGGYAALAGVTIQQGLYRCAVSVAGITDLSRFTNYRDDEMGLSARRFVNALTAPDSPTDPTRLNDLSPVKLASRADAPILLVHGKDDTAVPFDQSIAMQNALKAAGKPVELVVMPNEDHWLSREETRTLMLKSAVAFVEKYNPPDPGS